MLPVVCRVLFVGVVGLLLFDGCWRVDVFVFLLVDAWWMLLPVVCVRA